MVLACRFCRPHNILALKRLPLQAVLHRQTGRFRVPSCLFQPKGQPVLQRIPHHANTQPQRGKHNLPQSKTTQLAGADLAKRKKAAPCCHEAALNTATGPPLNGLAKTKRPRQQTWHSLLLPFYPFTFLPLLEFRFQLVGRVVGEHIHRRGFLLEQVGDYLRVERDGRAEAVARHIVEHGLAHLARHGAAV